MDGVWAEEYEEDDDFLANYGEAIEVPEPGQKAKKAKLIDPEEAEKAPKRLSLTRREPRPKLDGDRLLEEQNGLPQLINMARDITFIEGQEVRDLKRTVALVKLWAHRCFSKYTFDDFITKCEKLETKRQIKTHLRKIRIGMVAVNSADPPEPEFTPKEANFSESDPFESNPQNEFSPPEPNSQTNPNHTNTFDSEPEQNSPPSFADMPEPEPFDDELNPLT